MVLSKCVVSNYLMEDGHACFILWSVIIIYNIALSSYWSFHSRCFYSSVRFINGCKDRYVVDAADRDSVPISRSELHELLTKPSLGGIPLLVLGNKIDKSEALSKQALVDQLWVLETNVVIYICWNLSWFIV